MEERARVVLLTQFLREGVRQTVFQGSHISLHLVLETADPVKGRAGRVDGHTGRHPQDEEEGEDRDRRRHGRRERRWRLQTNGKTLSRFKGLQSLS